jgi:hypothetical protein
MTLSVQATLRHRNSWLVRGRARRNRTRGIFNEEMQLGEDKEGTQLFQALV